MNISITKVKHYTVCFLYLTGIFKLTSQEPIGWASIGNTTGGHGADSIVVNSRESFINAFNTKGNIIILVKDTIELVDGERLDVVNSNITILGLGSNAMIRNGGIKIYGNNIIVRNISFGESYIDGHFNGKGSPGTDGITVYGKNIWIDHCDFFHSYDGLLDVSRGGDLITISWCHFSKHNKVILIGSSDKDTVCRNGLRVTIHHCWFDGVPSFYDQVDDKHYYIYQRMPRVRFGDVHVYNNYYENVKNYCIAARFESEIMVENNFFRNLDDAHIIIDFNKGLKDPELVARNNIYENIKGKKMVNGDAFNPSDQYKYKLDSTYDIPAIVMNGAGKINRIKNNPPVTVSDTIIIMNSNPVEIKPLKNDYDVDNDQIRISNILNIPKGECIIYPETIEYIPVTGLEIDIIDYEIIDFEGGVSNNKIHVKYE